MGKLAKWVGWLNEKPGRKRGLGAALFGLGAALRYLGHTDAAQAAEAGEALLQTLVPGVDLLATVVTVVGLVHAKQRKG